MNNISPSFTSSSIIYGFIYLYCCTHSFTIPLFASCLSLVCFSLRKVHLPLQVTVFPTLFNTNHISFWVWLKEKISEMITILQVFCLFFAISFLVKVWLCCTATSKPLPSCLCLLVNTTSHHVYCSLLPLSPTLCLWQSAYINLSTISSSLFSSIAPSTLKPQTFPNITRNTSSFSSSSQANTINHSPLKSLHFILLHFSATCEVFVWKSQPVTFLTYF